MENDHRRGTSKRLARLLAFALALGACTAPGARLAPGADSQREPLNSERIARRFGSYGVEILESDARLHVSSLYSAEVYHPDYLRLANLRALYGRGVPTSAASDPELLAILDLVAMAVRGPSDWRHATAAFSDDFEGYQAGQAPGAAWTVETSPGATVAVDTSHARSGSKSVQLHTPAGIGTKTAFIRLAKDGGFPLASNAFFGRMMFRLESAPEAIEPAVHWTFIQAGGAVAGQTYRALYSYGGQDPVTAGSRFVGGQLMANYDTPDWYDGTGPGSDCWKHADRVVAPVGRWVCVEWQMDGPADSMRFWLDGAPVESLTVSGTGQGCVNQPSNYHWTAPVFEQVDLGWESYQPDAARTIWIDDVAIARTRIGCP